MRPSTPNPLNSISDKRRKYEIIAVSITGIGKLIFMDLLHWRLPFILVAVIGWAAYVISRSKKIPGVLPYWGFRIDNFKNVTHKILPFGIVSVITFFVVGYERGTINLTWHIIPVLILYPIWGIIQ